MKATRLSAAGLELLFETGVVAKGVAEGTESESEHGFATESWALLEIAPA